MSVVDDLIKEGKVDSRGVFTVDVAKAQEKLERFRLADPLGYVVELVQAAGLSGAKQVDVDVDASRFVIRFDGRAFSAADLQDLESAVLVKNTADHPARQQLALGVSAARGLDPREVVVQSGTRKLTIDGDGVITASDAAALPAPWKTEVTIVESFQLGHFVEFFRGAFGLQKEVQLLRRRCRHARFTVTVNGTVVSGQPPPCDLAIDVVNDVVTGFIGFQRGSMMPARAVLLRAGVVQEEIVFDDEDCSKDWHAPRGFVAVLDVPHLQRDASFSRFVRDERFEAALRLALARGPGVVELLAKEIEQTEHGRWATTVAKDLLRALGPVGPGRRAGTPSNGADKRAAKGLRKLRIFRDALGAPLALEDVLDDAEKHGSIAVVGRTMDPARLTPPRVVMSVAADIDRAIANVLGPPVQDVGGDIEAAVAREARRVQWQARQSTCALPTDLPWASSTRFEVPGVGRGVVGYRRHGGDPLQVTVLSEGCHLTTLTVPFAVPGMTLVVEGKLSATRDYDDVVRDAALARLLVQAAAAIPFVIDGADRAVWSGARDRTALMACMALLVDGEALVPSLLDGAGCKPVDHVPLPRIAADHRCVTAVVLPTLQGHRTSLQELVEGKGPIGVVALDVPDFEPSIEPTLRAGEVLRGVLRVVAPHRALTSLNDEAIRARRLVELRTRRPASLSLVGVDGSVPAGTRSETDRHVVDGFVGWKKGGGRGQLDLALFVEGRPVQRLQLHAPLTGLVAALNDDRLELNKDLEPRGPFDVHVDVVLGAVPRLLPLLPDPWPLAAAVVACLLPGEAHRRALARLEQNLPAAEVAAAWSEVLALATGSADGDVAAALELVLDEGAVPTVDRVAALLDRKSKPGKSKTQTTQATPPADARLRLLRPVLEGSLSTPPTPLVDRLVTAFGIAELTVRRFDYRSARLGDVLRQPKIRFVNSARAPVDGFDDVVVLTGGARDVVLALRGPEGVEDVAPALAALDARRAFERKGAVAAEVDVDVKTVARVTIDEAGVRGEVALLDGPPSAKPQADLVVLHGGKTLARVPVGRFLGAAMLAVIDTDDVTPAPGFDNVVHDDKLTALIERVRQARELLLVSLVDAAEARAAGGDDRGGGDNDGVIGAPAGVRARLLERLRLSHTDKNQALPTAGLAGRIARLPFFTTLRGEHRSLADIADDDGTVRFLPFGASSGPRAKLERVADGVLTASVDASFDGAFDGESRELAGFDDVVSLPSAAERELLAKGFVLQDVDKEWQAALRLRATRRRLPPLLFDAVERGLVVHEARLGSSTLRLAVPSEPPERARPLLSVGDDGLLVATLPHPAGLPCDGVLFGDGAITRDFQRVRVDDKMSASIAREATVLWGKAIDRFRADEGADVRDVGVRDDGARRVLRAWLRMLALQAAGPGSDRLPTTLRARLLEVQVLPVDDGGFISVSRAVAEQPPSLSHVLRAHGLARDIEVDTPTASSSRSVDPPTRESTRSTTTTTTPAATAEIEPLSDEVRLRDRLLSIINVVRDRGLPLTGDLELSRLIVETGKGKRAAFIDVKRASVVVDLAHPVAAAAVDDGAALVVLTSLVVTRINERLTSVSDDDERRFHLGLILHAATIDGTPTT